MASKNLTTYVALLRGINVGGNHKVSMAELKISVENLGLQNVKTYINSGNVIFRSTGLSDDKLEAMLEQKLEADYGFPILVVVRNLAQIETIIKQAPKSWLSAKDQKCNVIFLSRSIDYPGVMDGLNPKSGIEELHYHPGVLLWSASTSNLTKSNMIKLASNPIYKNVTIRIFNTVLKLRQLMQDAERS